MKRIPSLSRCSVYILVSLAISVMACTEGADSLPTVCAEGITAEEAQLQGLTCIPGEESPFGTDSGEGGTFPDIVGVSTTDVNAEIDTFEEKEPDTFPPPDPTEDCDNSKDDDEDSLIDCKDDDCDGDPACVEIQCIDKHDNDFDGLLDCEDPDCAWHPDCGAQTCSDFYGCLAEDGCDCQLSSDCPEAGTPAYTVCQSTCINDQICSEDCENELTEEYQEYLAIFQLCGSALCNDQETDEEYGSCLQKNCLEPYAYCFFTGPSECADFYFICAKDCGANCPEDDELCVDTCVDDCVQAMSPEAYIDAVHWDSCRYELCSKGEDNDIESDACYYIGSFFACVDVAQSCIPEYFLEGTGTCGSVTQCLVNCESFDEGGCVLGCLEQVGETNTFLISNLFTCVITECGSGESELTPACTSQALNGACNAEWVLCSS